jgi:hypothetical protein
MADQTAVPRTVPLFMPLDYSRSARMIRSGVTQRLETGEVPSEEPLKCVAERGVIVAIRVHEFPPRATGAIATPYMARCHLQSTRLSPMPERVKLARQLFARGNDWVAPSNWHWERIAPSIAWWIQEECIPHRVGRRLQRTLRAPIEHRRQVRQVRCTERAPLVPVVRHALVGQQRRRPFPTRVTWVHVEPHRIDPEVCAWVLREELFLRPPGCVEAGRSGRR